MGRLSLVLMVAISIAFLISMTGGETDSTATEPQTLFPIPVKRRPPAKSSKSSKSSTGSSSKSSSGTNVGAKSSTRASPNVKSMLDSWTDMLKTLLGWLPTYVQITNKLLIWLSPITESLKDKCSVSEDACKDHSITISLFDINDLSSCVQDNLDLCTNQHLIVNKLYNTLVCVVGQVIHLLDLIGLKPLQPFLVNLLSPVYIGVFLVLYSLNPILLEVMVLLDFLSGTRPISMADLASIFFAKA